MNTFQALKPRRDKNTDKNTVKNATAEEWHCVFRGGPGRKNLGFGASYCGK